MRQTHLLVLLDALPKLTQLSFPFLLFLCGGTSVCQSVFSAISCVRHRVEFLSQILELLHAFLGGIFPPLFRTTDLVELVLCARGG
jgi:hypothetical protein